MPKKEKHLTFKPTDWLKGKVVFYVHPDNGGFYQGRVVRVYGKRKLIAVMIARASYDGKHFNWKGPQFKLPSALIRCVLLRGKEVPIGQLVPVA